MFREWNFWCTVMTSIAAVVALGLSVYQIQLSNKQQLFDRRLKAYNLVSSLISLCKENYTWLSEKRETKPQLTNDFDFIYLPTIHILKVKQKLLNIRWNSHFIRNF